MAKNHDFGQIDTQLAKVKKHSDSEGLQKDFSRENIEETNSNSNKLLEVQYITNNIIEEDKCDSNNDSTVIKEDNETNGLADTLVVKPSQQNNDLSENECKSSPSETKDDSVPSDYVTLQRITKEVHDRGNDNSKSKSEIIGTSIKYMYSQSNFIRNFYSYMPIIFILTTLDLIDDSMLKLLALQRLNQLFPNAVDVKVSVYSRHIFLVEPFSSCTPAIYLISLTLFGLSHNAFL